MQSTELFSLIRWYLGLREFPSTPYKLAPHLLAQDGYFQRLLDECRRVLKDSSPRSRNGALQVELELVKRAIEHDVDDEEDW